MATDGEIIFLSRLLDMYYRGKLPENDRINVRHVAEKNGIDIDKIMTEIIEICGKQNYNVGTHMFCTRANVIPRYLEIGELRLDRDHAEGLLQILAVHQGKKRDY